MTEEKKLKVESDEDWIDYPKYKNSIKKLLMNDKYENGAENDVIAKSLMISEEEVEALYQSAVAKLKAKLDPDNQ